jgi:light-regulated signal transduction histidine kinase (bacteriophytochrome)
VKPVDLTTCDREPIHIPGAIQPFGALLAIDADGRLVRASANASSLLGPLPPVGQPLPAAYLESFAPWLAARKRGENGELDPIELPLADRTFDVIVHHSAPWLVLEFEPRDPKDPAHATFALKAQRALERVQRQRTLPGLLDVATEELWRLTGFDRVMAYQFRHDDSGHVVSERRRPDLETFLGLRYPATDIPVQARRLFTLNRLRFIPDLSYQSVLIEPSCGAEAPDPLDLSHSMLRSVSPIHVEYLQNMGVSASMSISLVVGNRLWGLFACHHYSGARLVPHAVRTACALIAQVVSVLVERIEVEQHTRALEAARTLRESLSWRARAAEDVVAALGESPSFVDLIDASGGAILWEKRVRFLGRTPHLDAAGDLADWLRSSNDEIVKTSELGAVAPALASRLDGTAGLLAVRFHREHDGWLIWFRPEEAEVVRWAGNPEKTYSEGPMGQRLNPRGSFREWRETVRGRAAPWRQHESDVAAAFRLDIQEVALAKLSEFERARDVMLAALGHDLRTPLSAIVMAASLLKGGETNQANLGHRIARSSNRMQRLVDQMLDVSRIQSGLGLGIQATSGDLAALVKHAVEEARLGFPGSELTVLIPDTMNAFFDADRMGQVVSNLISNARHHGQVGRPIRIELTGTTNEAVIAVTNEGGPIPPATRARIFQPFKVESLEQQRNRNGLGLGLHIVHEIVKSHQGRIEIDDASGVVTFRIVLPLAPSKSE